MSLGYEAVLQADTQLSIFFYIFIVFLRSSCGIWHIKDSLHMLSQTNTHSTVHILKFTFTWLENIYISLYKYGLCGKMYSICYLINTGNSLLSPRT